MKTLVILTFYYPYNRIETYLETEILYLANAFDEIHIISNEQDINEPRKIPANAKSYSIPYHLGLFDKLKSLFHLMDKNFWQEIKFIQKQYKQPLSFQIVNTILQSLYKAERLQELLPGMIPGIFNKTDVTFYSYWASDNAVGIAFLKKNYPHIRAVTRAHRWDVYFDKNGSGYLPLRKLLFENLNRIYFISDHAKNYFVAKTRLNSDKLKVARLGVHALASPMYINKPAEFHLLSCSYVYARKRVAMIAKALDQIDSEIKIKWTHIGGGELFDELRALVDDILSRKKNLTIHLLGMLTQQEVKNFYALNYVDLFLNVSASEGVPVSIMEAFSASVPVIATDADGTAEIVLHRKNGLLIDCNFSSVELATQIQQYLLQPVETKERYRVSAKQTYLEKYDEKKNYTDFISSLLKI